MLVGNLIRLRHYTDEDASAVLEYQVKNRKFFSPYLPEPPESSYTLEQQQKVIAKWAEEQQQDKRYTFGIYLKDSGRLVGDISLFEVARGPRQSAILGYSLDQDHNGRGYMREAVSLVIRYGFKELGLHRLEAGAKPDNSGSIRTLQKSGFRQEGIARKFLLLNGQWEDHVTFSLVAEDLE
ncbi:MAG: alanine acetyltransferase [Paenibacillaceae bacterium]|jgi:ribosomal-protein-alanine N-acetyltransferase|nr:alanine acetyltransferase [Paenibacillaceae bacterium]